MVNNLLGNFINVLSNNTAEKESDESKEYVINNEDYTLLCDTFFEKFWKI